MSDELIEAVLEDAGDHMDKAVAHARHEFAGVRTGRANPGLVEKLPVDYYGASTPLQQLASFSVPDARMLVITPFDKGAMGGIERAIQDSGLGLNPSNDGV
ncbi:MAG TPA: ribosome recycling factor, partial [Microthrixaceae bacterium]|nr:ribosome recycling factor [Microthrixaceae bacterium]